LYNTLKRKGWQSENENGQVDLLNSYNARDHVRGFYIGTTYAVAYQPYPKPK
jgi:hypothetical protein